MRHAWELPRQTSLPSGAPDWREPNVLLEYEGPQLVVLRNDSQDFLGLAVDAQEHWVRWIFAPMSRLEFEALVRGGASVRAVLVKDRVIVVDYEGDTGEKRNVWEVDANSLPTSALPERGAPLPESIRRHLRAEFAREVEATVAQPSFDLGGKTHILFEDLAAVTGRLKTLWNALAQGMQQPVPTLAATAITSGSLRLQVYTDNVALFERIAGRYRDLTFASDDPSELKRTLSREAGSVAWAYQDYLKALALHRVEILAKWGDEAAYLGHGLATRTRHDLVSFAATEEPVTSEVERFRGYFEGFWPTRRPRFQFYDLTTGDTITGKIEAVLRKRFARDFEVGVMLGRGFQMYDATIVVERRRGEITGYTLQDYEAVTQEPGG